MSLLLGLLTNKYVIIGGTIVVAAIGAYLWVYHSAAAAVAAAAAKGDACGAVRAVLDRDDAVISLSDGGAHCGIICDASFPTYMLTHWVRDRDRGARLPLDESAGPLRLHGYVGLPTASKARSPNDRVSAFSSRHSRPVSPFFSARSRPTRKSSSSRASPATGPARTNIARVVCYFKNAGLTFRLSVNRVCPRHLLSI